MSDQSGYSEFIKSTLGTEKQILRGDKSTFHCAMSIDEMEEILDMDDVFALYWIIDSVEEEDRGGYLEKIRDAYREAVEA